MKIQQALVAVGGQGSRLSKDGINVPLAKSFLELNDKALFYWCLWGLYSAGITKLIIVGNSEEKLKVISRKRNQNRYRGTV